MPNASDEKELNPSLLTRKQISNQIQNLFEKRHAILNYSQRETLLISEAFVKIDSGNIKAAINNLRLAFDAHHEIYSTLELLDAYSVYLREAREHPLTETYHKWAIEGLNYFRAAFLLPCMKKNTTTALKKLAKNFLNNIKKPEVNAEFYFALSVHELIQLIAIQTKAKKSDVEKQLVENLSAFEEPDYIATRSKNLMEDGQSETLEIIIPRPENLTHPPQQESTPVYNISSDSNNSKSITVYWRIAPSPLLDKTAYNEKLPPEPKFTPWYKNTKFLLGLFLTAGSIALCATGIGATIGIPALVLITAAKSIGVFGVFLIFPSAILSSLAGSILVAESFEGLVKGSDLMEEAQKENKLYQETIKNIQNTKEDPFSSDFVSSSANVHIALSKSGNTPKVTQQPIPPENQQNKKSIQPTIHLQPKSNNDHSHEVTHIRRTNSF